MSSSLWPAPALDSRHSLPAGGNVRLVHTHTLLDLIAAAHTLLDLVAAAHQIAHTLVHRCGSGTTPKDQARDGEEQLRRWLGSLRPRLAWFFVCRQSIVCRV